MHKKPVELPSTIYSGVRDCTQPMPIDGGAVREYTPDSTIRVPTRLEGAE
jgi:hypothetical protein